MSKSDESSNGRMGDAAFKRVEELEASLRNLRPRAPRIDSGRLTETADATDNSLAPTVTTSERDWTRAVRSSSLRRPWGAVAGAWACGAIVGGLTVFFIMQHSVSESRPLVESVSSESPGATVRERRSVERETQQHRSEAVDATRSRIAIGTTAKPAHDADVDAWSTLSDGSTGALVAGSHLRQFELGASGGNGESVVVVYDDRSDSDFDWNDHDSQPPITRAWLLDELTRTSRRTL